MYQCFGHNKSWRRIPMFSDTKLFYFFHPVKIFLVNTVPYFQDTGVGMSKEEMVENLGTIARSGSKVTM